MANDDVKVRNTETINQNIYSGKLINNYCKQFETLLMKNDGNGSTAPTPHQNRNNNFSQFQRSKPPPLPPPIAANRT